MDARTGNRLYASSIAIVSGLYALASSAWAATRAPMEADPSASLGVGGWLMLGVGIVVLGHGIVLLTPLAVSMRRSSGPLMVLWSVSMLINQALLAVIPGFGMSGPRTGEDMMGSPMTAGMGWDAGMVAIAVLMLASGLIMSSQRSSDAGV